MNKLIKTVVSLSAVFTALTVVCFAFSSENALADNPANKPHPCDSIKDRETESVIIIRGRAEDANWGWSKVSDVIYSFHVKNKSEIVKVEKLRNGGRKVIEKRTFEKAEDKMLVTPVDVRLRLDTLPIKEVRQLLKIISVLFDVQIPEFPNNSKDSERPERSGEYESGNLKKLDKTAQLKELLNNAEKNFPELKKFLTSKNINNSAQVIEYLKKAFMGDTLLIKEFQGARNLMFDEKNTFLVTWFFDANGDVTDVTYRYAKDESLVTDEETRQILKRGNLLIDYCFVRSNEEPIVDGATGYLEASDIQYVFDPFVDGDYRGLIKFKAKKQSDSEWELNLPDKSKPIRVVAKNGSITKTTGSLNPTKGVLRIKNIGKEKFLEIHDLKGAQLDASIEGKAAMNHQSRHHWLFKAKYDGEFIFDGEMSSKVIDK